MEKFFEKENVCVEIDLTTFGMILSFSYTHTHMRYKFESKSQVVYYYLSQDFAFDTFSVLSPFRTTSSSSHSSRIR